MKRALITGALLIIIGLLVFKAVFHKTNSPPTAMNGSIETKEDTPVSISLKGSDKEGKPLKYFILTKPFHGSLSGTEPNLIYTPELNFNGVDSITFKVNNGVSDSNSAYFTIMVTPVNDPPTAKNDIVEIKEDVPMIQINVLANDTDEDNDELTILGTADVSQGTTVISNDNKSITYIPNKNFSGSDSFVYTIRDGKGGTSTATVQIKIIPVNDAPRIKSKPVTAARVWGTYNYQVQAVDPDPTDTLTYSLIKKPEGMKINSETGLIEWQPKSSQSGDFDVQVEVEDSNTVSASAIQEFKITVASLDSPLTETMTIKGGYNSQSRKPLSEENKDSISKADDDKWYEISGNTYTSFVFSDTPIPEGATIGSAVLYVRHYEDKNLKAGQIQWNLGTGWPEKPENWFSLKAPIYEGKDSASSDSWDITSIVNTPEKINSFQLQINNTGNIISQKTFIDNIYVIVKWY